MIETLNSLSFSAWVGVITGMLTLVGALLQYLNARRKAISKQEAMLRDELSNLHEDQKKRSIKLYQRLVSVEKALRVLIHAIERDDGIDWNPHDKIQTYLDDMPDTQEVFYNDVTS